MTPANDAAATIYRGFDIKPHQDGGICWIDERGFTHGPLDGEEEAQNEIDAHKRAQRQAASQ